MIVYSSHKLQFPFYFERIGNHTKKKSRSCFVSSIKLDNNIVKKMGNCGDRRRNPDESHSNFTKEDRNKLGMTLNLISKCQQSPRKKLFQMLQQMV